MKIDGLKAVVTGGASGLGLATAAMLIDHGADVTVFDADGSPEKRAAVKAIYARFSETNVTDEAAVVAAFEEVTDGGEPPRILVNCAGVAPSVRMFRYEGVHPVDVFRHTVDVNLTGTFIPISKFAAKLRGVDAIDNERGVIINTASIVASDGQEGHAAYAASKGAVVGMTLPLARELGRELIRVMTIAPGLFDTPLLQAVSMQDRYEICTQVPHPARMGEPAEFAHLVESIITNPMLNGDTIRLDGALRLAPF